MEEAQKKLLVSDLEDPRNANILCWIGSPDGGQLYPRDMAGISPFDSAVQGGDAVWEGLRVYRGKILYCQNGNVRPEGKLPMTTPKALPSSLLHRGGILLKLLTPKYTTTI